MIILNRRFITKVVKIFNETGLQNLLKDKIKPEDVRDEVLTNLFCYEDNPLCVNDSYADDVFWILRKLKRINRLIASKQLDANIINIYGNKRPKIQMKANDNVSVLCNLFSRNYVYYYLTKDGLREKEITRDELKLAKKAKCNYRVIKDNKSEIHFVYRNEYLSTLKADRFADPEHAVAAIVTNALTNYDKSISVIEAYDESFHAELTALNSVNGVIDEAVTTQLIQTAIFCSIIMSNLHLISFKK